MILLDTSVLIEYFRKTNKKKTFFYELSKKYPVMGISVITKYEIFVGSSNLQDIFWKGLFEELTLFPFSDKEMYEAVTIQKKLLSKNQIIGFGDVAIGATARVQNLQLATLNIKHFKRIEALTLITRE